MTTGRINQNAAVLTAPVRPCRPLPSLRLRRTEGGWRAARLQGAAVPPPGQNPGRLDTHTEERRPERPRPCPRNREAAPDPFTRGGRTPMYSLVRTRGACVELKNPSLTPRTSRHCKRMQTGRAYRAPPTTDRPLSPPGNSCHGPLPVERSTALRPKPGVGDHYAV